MREVGHTIPVGTWWLNLVRQVITRESRDLKTLGESLAKHVDREAPFDKALLSRLRKGEAAVTIELIEALCTEYRGLPRPVYFARSRDEAVHILKAIDDYEATVGAEVEDEAPIVDLPDRKRRRRPAPSAGAAPAVTRRRLAR